MSAPTPPPAPGPASPPLSSHLQSHHHTSHIMTNTAHQQTTSLTNSDTLSGQGQGPNDAATKLAEAIDDFLGDLEKKFKGISDEILTKLDDMAERCDRLEQEMLVRETSAIALEKPGSTAGSG